MDKYLRIKDIQEIYGVTRHTVRNWVKKGMPVMKQGNTVRFKADEIEEWFKKSS